MVEKNNFAGADIDAMVIFNDKRESDADFTVTATLVDFITDNIWGTNTRNTQT